MGYLPSFNSLRDVRISSSITGQVPRLSATGQWENYSWNIQDLFNIPALPNSAGTYFLNYSQSSGNFTWDLINTLGAFTNFLVTGNSGTPQTVSDGQTLTIRGAATTPFLLNAQATNILELSLNLAGAANGDVLQLQSGSVQWGVTLGIDPGSAGFASFDPVTRLLSITPTQFNSVTVDGAANIANFASANYTGSEYVEGDIIILSNATETWIHNGGVAGDENDFSQMLFPGALTTLTLAGDSGSIAITNGNTISMLTAANMPFSFTAAAGPQATLDWSVTPPTGGTAKYLLQWDDDGDTFSWITAVTTDTHFLNDSITAPSASQSLTHDFDQATMTWNDVTQFIINTINTSTAESVFTFSSTAGTPTSLVHKNPSVGTESASLSLNYASGIIISVGDNAGALLNLSTPDVIGSSAVSDAPLLLETTGGVVEYAEYALMRTKPGSDGKYRMALLNQVGLSLLRGRNLVF